jgi:hypothetical protein
VSKVFVAVPAYGQGITWAAARAIWCTGTRLHRFDVAQSSMSLITMNCNTLWCAALNRRATHEVEWFAMLHTDVEPSDWWVDQLIAEAEKHGADMMSAIIPLKNSTGSTSTGIANAGDRCGQYCRLTQTQVRHPAFPDTFGIDEAVEALERLPDPLRIIGAPRELLLVNTGCFVCRINRPWAEKVWFEQTDGIELKNGSWGPISQPEDWNFSRRVAASGGKVMATRLVKVIHRGETEFHSDAVWGQPRDLAGLPELRF